MANFLFSDSRAGQRKGSYLPIQILLLLLIKEELKENEFLKISLRKCILQQIKIMNRDVQAYIEDESEFAQIMIVKLAFYFMALPREVELLAN
jgi:hypothetical protein